MVVSAPSELLAEGVTFDWATFGLQISGTVAEFVPQLRLGWYENGKGPGAYHTWLLVPRDHGTYVVSEEIGLGDGAKRLAQTNPGHVHRGHDLWNISLKFLCETSGRKPGDRNTTGDVTDWSTTSSLATGAGTLVLAVATFPRPSNISATLDESAKLAALTSLSPLPTSKSQCKHGGWRSFGGRFRNQGDCVSFVATGGRNQPSGRQTPRGRKSLKRPRATGVPSVSSPSPGRRPVR